MEQKSIQGQSPGGLAPSADAEHTISNQADYAVPKIRRQTREFEIFRPGPPRKRPQAVQKQQQQPTNQTEQQLHENENSAAKSAVSQPPAQKHPTKQEQLLQTRISDLETALRKALDELAKQSAAASARQTEIRDLNERLDDSERRGAEYLRQIQELRARIASVPNVVERLNAALTQTDDLRRQLADAEEEKEHLKRELASKTDQIAQFGTVGESLRAQMEARDQLEQQISAARAELDEKSKKVHELEQERARLKSAADDANRRIEEQRAESEREIAELRKKLNSAQSAFEDGVHCMLDQATGDAEQLQRLALENQTLKRMVVDQSENAERLSRQNAQIQTLDSRLFALASENAELKTQRAELIGTRAQLRGMQEELNDIYAAQVDAENDQLDVAGQLELSQLRQQLNEYVQRAVAQDNLLNDYKQELRQAQKQVKVLQKQLDAQSAHAKYGDASASPQKAEGRQPTVDQQQRILRDLQTMLQVNSQFQLVAEVSRLLDKVYADEDRLAELERQQRRLEAENLSYQKSVQSLLSKVYDMGQSMSGRSALGAPEISQFADALRTKERQIAELRQRLQKYGE